ncbi:hypothetical protein ACH5RR_041393 [Cinchona calisaya]|uniref:Uncharacterized protein n=1 Tax=Cinchona calisaya TaxID=153742 RepID=A0ABD2XVA6_9GENT
MADYNRSKSYSYSVDRNRMQMNDNYHPYGPPRSISSAYPNDHFRSYSTSYSSSYGAQLPQLPPPPAAQMKDWKLKKGKSRNGSSISKSWSFNDPEFQRRKRVASYKVYSVEGKVKGSFRRSFRWLKDKYTQVVYGWW